MKRKSHFPAIATSSIPPVAVAVLAIAIFVVDTLTDLEIAVAVFYVAVVLMSVSFFQKRGVVLVWGAQKLVIDWTLIGDEASARLFGDQLLEAPRSFADRTSISGGLYFSLRQLDRAPYEASRRAIDVSGDGTNNSGPEVTSARDEVLSKGVTINGLVILTPAGGMPWNSEHTNPPGGLEKYYRDNVIGGPGAFVVVAEDFSSFGQAILKKLIAEIALLPQPALIE